MSSGRSMRYSNERESTLQRGQRSSAQYSALTVIDTFSNIKTLLKITNSRENSERYWRLFSDPPLGHVHKICREEITLAHCCWRHAPGVTALKHCLPSSSHGRTLMYWSQQSLCTMPRCMR